MSKGKFSFGILICEVTYLMIKGKHHFAIYFGSTFRFLDFEYAKPLRHFFNDFEYAQSSEHFFTRF